MSLSETMNMETNVSANEVVDTNTNKARTRRAVKEGGPKSDTFECIHILGSPFWVQPLRVPEAKYKQTMATLEQKPGQKSSISTYKGSVPFAALFVAHEDTVIPRLPVERTSKTGFLPAEIERVLVKKGEEVVMTYLEIALLATEEGFNNKFMFRGTPCGLTVTYKQDNFNRKQSKVGPNGSRIPTPSLVATDGKGISAKKTMVMINKRDPLDPSKAVWGTTPRDLLYKERYEHMPEGRPTCGRRRNANARVENANVKVSASTQAAMNCREYLKSLGMQFESLEEPENAQVTTDTQANNLTENED